MVTRISVMATKNIAHPVTTRSIPRLLVINHSVLRRPGPQDRSIDVIGVARPAADS